jgi:hypothetical protein
LPFEAEGQRIKLEEPISTNKPGMVAHTCGPIYTADIGRRITVLV